MLRRSFLGALAALAFCGPALAASPTLDLTSDATAKAGSGSSGTSVNITTAGTNEAILAIIISQGNTGARTVSTVTAAGGVITFAKLKSCAVTGTNGVKLNEEIWDAPSAAQQTALAITYALTGGAAGNPDSSSIEVIGVKTLFNISSPLDSNASATSCGSTVAGAASSALTTTQTNDLLFGAGMHTYGSNTYTSGAWAVAGPTDNTLGAQNNMVNALAALGVAATQSGVNVDLTTAETTNPSVLIGLAFTNDNNAGGSTAHQLSASGAGQ